MVAVWIVMRFDWVHSAGYIEVARPVTPPASPWATGAPGLASFPAHGASASACSLRLDSCPAGAPFTGSGRSDWCSLFAVVSRLTASRWVCAAPFFSMCLPLRSSKLETGIVICSRWNGRKRPCLLSSPSASAPVAPHGTACRHGSSGIGVPICGSISFGGVCLFSDEMMEGKPPAGPPTVPSRVLHSSLSPRAPVGGSLRCAPPLPGCPCTGKAALAV